MLHRNLSTLVPRNKVTSALTNLLMNRVRLHDRRSRKLDLRVHRLDKREVDLILGQKGLNLDLGVNAGVCVDEESTSSLVELLLNVIRRKEEVVLKDSNTLVEGLGSSSKVELSKKVVDEFSEGIRVVALLGSDHTNELTQVLSALQEELLVGERLASGDDSGDSEVAEEVGGIELDDVEHLLVVLGVIVVGVEVVEAIKEEAASTGVVEGEEEHPVEEPRALLDLLGGGDLGALVDRLTEKASILEDSVPVLTIDEAGGELAPESHEAVLVVVGEEAVDAESDIRITVHADVEHKTAIFVKSLDVVKSDAMVLREVIEGNLVVFLHGGEFGFVKDGC
jgi:hypothetical protein